MLKILAIILALATPALAGPKVVIVIGEKAHALEQLAAKQIAQDFKALFEAEASIQTSLPAEGGAVIILGSTNSNPAIPGEIVPPVSPDGHVLKSTPRGLVLLAGSPPAAIWAASELSYHFGMRHLLRGDVMPIEKPGLKLDGIDLRLEPKISSRVWDGFIGLPFGLDSWSAEDAEQFLVQLARLKFTHIILPEKPAPFASLPVDGDSAGRTAFKGAKAFANPDIATVVERLKKRATELGITALPAQLVDVPVVDFGGPENSVLPEVSLAKLARKHTAPVIIRAKVTGDLDAPAHFLCRAAFDEEITPERALAALVTPICGEGVSERLWMGFDHLSKAAGLIAGNDPRIGVPEPKVFLRHLESKAPLPAWITEVKGHYLAAMNEMYRGNTRARGGARPFILYHAKRMEFALHYFTALESLYKAHDPSARAEALEAAVEASYNALNAYADVARDASDRGVIAVLNQDGYRVLLKAADADAK